MCKCLLVVDMLNDFVAEGGALKVEGAIDLIPTINSLREKFDKAVFVMDCHTEEDPEFEVFPPHAIEFQWGSKMHSDIDLKECDVAFQKAKLSCFTNPEVHKYLLENRIDELYVVGVATEYCVRGAVLDALDLGLKVNVVVDAIAGVDLKAGDQFKALIKMGNNGAVAINACDIK